MCLTVQQVNKGFIFTTPNAQLLGVLSNTSVSRCRSVAPVKKNSDGRPGKYCAIFGLINLIYTEYLWKILVPLISSANLLLRSQILGLM